MSEWKDVPGYEGLYRVSDAGVVFSIRLGAALKPMMTGNKRKQYCTVALCKGGAQRHFKVHLLVLVLFVGPRPPNSLGCHADDNPLNNAKSNLYWGSFRSNARDMVRNGNHAGQKLSHAQVVEIYRRRNAGERGSDLAKEFGVSQQVVWNVANKKTGGYLHG